MAVIMRCAPKDAAADRAAAAAARAELDEAERVSSMPRNWCRPYSLAAQSAMSLGVLGGQGPPG